MTYDGSTDTEDSEQFAPEYDINELAPHVYLRSIHNVPIERSWLRLRLDFGENGLITFKRGIDEGIYDDQDPDQL